MRPPGGEARFSSGLSVLDFMKRTSFIQLDQAALQALARPPSRWPRPRACPPTPFHRAGSAYEVHLRARRRPCVQALHQLDMEGTPLASLLDEFHRHRLGAEIEGAQYAKARVARFDASVTGVQARKDEVDAVISDKLAEGWAGTRLDKTMRRSCAGAWGTVGARRRCRPVQQSANVDVARLLREA